MCFRENGVCAERTRSNQNLSVAPKDYPCVTVFALACTQGPCPGRALADAAGGGRAPETMTVAG